MAQPRYSIIVPLYNEQENIPALYARLAATAARLDGDAEFVLVDDGSRDGSLDLLRDLRHRDDRVRYLSLARNFGHQIAVTAGLHFAGGNAVVVMDGDLQDPPELIPELIGKWREGYGVVFAQRTGRQEEAMLKRLFAYGYYRLLRRLAPVEIPADTGDFCLMDRRVVDVLNSMPERHRYIRGLRAWTGFRQTAVSFARDPRHAGRAKYTFRKSLGLAVNGVVSFSVAPLRLFTYLGLASAAIAVLMAFLIVYWRLFQPGSPVSGFAAIATIQFMLSAVLLVGIGILGEYLGRVFEEVKQRPLYTLREVSGFTHAHSIEGPAGPSPNAAGS
jgi:dolichol-phosphate mannosyltransferase